MSSPRCPRCYRRLYNGLSEAAHQASGNCTLGEVESNEDRKKRQKRKKDDGA